MPPPFQPVEQYPCSLPPPACWRHRPGPMSPASLREEITGDLQRQLADYAATEALLARP